MCHNSYLFLKLDQGFDDILVSMYKNDGMILSLSY